MRFVAGLVVAGALLMAPSAAFAQGAPHCPLSAGPIDPATVNDPNGPYAFQAIILPHLEAGEQAARAALGAQYGGLFVDTPRQGWTISLSPGTLDAQAARAAIIDRLPPGAAAALASRLTVLPTLYSEAELIAVQNEVLALVKDLDLASGIGVSCHVSDAWRVEIGIIEPESPALAAQVRALFDRFGDKVVIQYGVGRMSLAMGGSPIAESDGAGSQRVRRFVSLPAPKHCVRGNSIGVKAGKQARSVTLSAGKRKVSGKSARLRLTARKTKVTVTVKLRNGGTVTQTFVYRRC